MLLILLPLVQGCRFPQQPVPRLQQLGVSLCPCLYHKYMLSSQSAAESLTGWTSDGFSSL